MQSTAREISDSKTSDRPGYVEYARALALILADFDLLERALARAWKPGHGMPAWGDCSEASRRWHLDRFAAPLWAVLAELEVQA